MVVVLTRNRSFSAAVFAIFLFLTSKPSYAVDELILPDYKGDMVEVENGENSISIPFVKGLSFTLAFSSGNFSTIAKWENSSKTSKEQINQHGGGEYVVNKVYIHFGDICLDYSKRLPLCKYVKRPVGDEPHIYSAFLTRWQRGENDPKSPFDDFIDSLTPFQGSGDYGDFRLYESENHSFCDPDRKKVICDFYAKARGDYIFGFTLTNYRRDKKRYAEFSENMRKSIDIIVSSINEWSRK